MIVLLLSLCKRCFLLYVVLFLFFFFKQKTAYEIGTGDWSSDVCSSDLHCMPFVFKQAGH